MHYLPGQVQYVSGTRTTLADWVRNAGIAW